MRVRSLEGKDSVLIRGTGNCFGANSVNVADVTLLGVEAEIVNNDDDDLPLRDGHSSLKG